MPRLPLLAQTAPLVDAFGIDPDRLGVVAILCFMLWAIMARRLVPGWVLDAVERDKERYRVIAERSMHATDRAMAVTQTVTGAP